VSYEISTKLGVYTVCLFRTVVDIDIDKVLMLQ